MKEVQTPASLTWRVPPGDIKKHYSYLIDEVKKSGCKAIIISMPLRVSQNEENNREYRRILEQIAREKNCLFVDIFNEWRRDKREDEGELFFDDVHPTVKGHRLIGERLYREIIVFPINRD